MRVVTCAAVALTAVCAAPAAAEPILVTAGSLTFSETNQFSPLVLEGTMGFTFNGHPGTGVFFPGDCFLPECLSGTPISLAARWTGNDLGGTATLNGSTYHAVGSLSSNTSMNAEFSGTILAPTTAADAAILTAPFSFFGQFFVDSFPESSAYEVIGQGVATASFVRHAGTDAWRIERLQYAFTSPVPEPSSLALIGLGGALAGLRSLKGRIKKARPSGRA
jgi:hypothetical protein